MTTLLEDIQKHYEDSSYLPIDDVDYDEEVAYERNGSLRWGTQIRVILRRGEEYVAIEDVEPATENQGWGDYGEPNIYNVVPRTETRVITRYVKDLPSLS